MITRRLFLFATAVVITLSQFAFAARANEAADGAVNFIKDFGNRSIEQLTVKGLSDKELQNRFRGLFDEGFDAQAIGRFVLGRHWRKATNGERAEFLRLFRDFIIQTYSGRFSEYSGETFEVTGVRAEPGNIFVVESSIIQPDGAPPVRLDWRVAPQNGGYKIYDITVEGVSMAVTQRSEFSSVIKRGGGKIDALITALRNKTTELASKTEVTSQ